jgi:hypothetical protein
MDAISATLTFLWEVVGYVEGLFFKDLKQTMKKEQCEVKLLVTASMPGNTNQQTDVNVNGSLKDSFIHEETLSLNS